MRDAIMNLRARAQVEVRLFVEMASYREHVCDSGERASVLTHNMKAELLNFKYIVWCDEVETRNLASIKVNLLWRS